ncbi:MAG: ankyrin repeat domain-containing protein [Candidatus Thiodiazotropha sp.]
MESTKDNINLPDEDGYYKIHRAVCECDAKNKDIKSLLRLGADIESLNPEGRTALHLACLAGHFHLVKLLICEGANVNAIDNEGHTPIFMAVEGSNSSINLLVDAGADIDHINHGNQTALMHACEIGKVGAVKYLCELGANARIDEFSSKSLIRLTLESIKSLSYTNALQMLRALVKAGATVDAVDVTNGQTELHVIAERTRNRWFGKQYFDLLKYLINSGANPWRYDDNNTSPLSLMDEAGLKLLRPALKRYLKGKELAVVTGIKTVVELKAFFFNQNKLTKREVYELLLEGTPAKQHFEEALALPSPIDT